MDVISVREAATVTLRSPREPKDVVAAPFQLQGRRKGLRIRCRLVSRVVAGRLPQAPVGPEFLDAKEAAAL